MTSIQIPAAPEGNIRKYSRQFSSFGNDYIFSRITKTEQFAEFTSHTMRMEGMTMVLCLSGSALLNVNMRKCELTPNTLLLISPQSVFNVGTIDWDSLDAYVFIMSPEFIRDINFEVSIITSFSPAANEQALLHLTDEEMRLMCRYLDLIHYNTVDNTEAEYVRSIARSLVSAATYQLMQFARNHAEENKPVKQSRRDNYVKEFLTLVSQYHKCERGVAFYAGKLYISPKYLSHIIKELTGKSAAEWIDNYVILEAKNLLKFSGKNVQQIAYELNFSNQSSFGKYFKHLTGVSPTKFQRG